MANEFDGRRVGAMVALLIALTAVLPPAAAYTLARSRISRAERLAAEAAGPLASRMPELRGIAATRPVLFGPGRLPDARGEGIPWLQTPAAAGSTFDAIWPQDPWGRAYLLDVAAVLGGGGLLISAGPNGSIDTPLGVSQPSGDDIAATVR